MTNTFDDKFPKARIALLRAAGYDVVRARRYGYVPLRGEHTCGLRERTKNDAWWMAWHVAEQDGAVTEE